MRSLKKKNKYFLSFVMTFIITLSFFLIEPNDQKTEEILAKKNTKASSDKVISLKDINIKKKSGMRKPASVSLNLNNKTIKRRYIGSSIPKDKIVLLNSESKDWRKKYKHNFLRMVKEDKVKDFKITLKESLIKVTRNSGRYIEHVIISYKKPNGDPFSFEAYIDSESGRVIQSWNQTRYEFKNPTVFKATGYKYKK